MAIICERRGIRLGALFLALSFLFPLGVSHAETLPELVQYLTQEHNLVKAAEEDANAARQRARVALGDWFPTLDVSMSYGFEDQTQPGADDTRFVTRDTDLKVTQLLWDFGKTNAALRRAGLVLEQALAVLDGVRQNVLLRGVTAYLNVSRRTQVLKFAKRSEGNIKKQADLEDALVQAGKGFSTDVLQAKARLAGAEARRINAHGRFEVAKNDYRALFEREPDNIYSQGIIHLPYESLPLTLEDAVQTAIKFNPGLKSESFGIQIAEEDVNSTRSDSFFPRLQGVFEQRYKKDFSGTVGFQRESLGKIELSFPFNLGFTSFNRLRAANHDRSATVRRFADRKDIVEQQTRDAWTNLLTARQRTSSLRNQAEIVMRFLEDARKERKAGRRSLLDVLDGETQLLNAQSDAASAEVDSAIAIFTLFEAMGQLKESIVLGRKSGEYLPEPRLGFDYGKLRNKGTETKFVQKPAVPSNKAPEFVFPLIHQDQADEESKVEARHQAGKETTSDLVASRRKLKQNPEADSGLSGSEQPAALRAENELEEPEPPAADSESIIFDLLAGIGRFFESAGDPGEIDESESVKAVVVELKTPDTSPETNVVSKKERSLISNPVDTSPEPDQVPEADSGPSWSEQTVALRAENELDEPGSEDLISTVIAWLEDTSQPTEIVEAENIELAELLSEASEPERDSDIEPKEARIETAESAPIGTTEPEPPAADSESTIFDLPAGIGRFFESAGDPGEIDESESVKAVVVELKTPDTSPETNVVSKKERSLISNPVDTSPEPDQVPEADSGPSWSEQTVALRAENELDEPGSEDLISTVIAWLEDTSQPTEIVEAENIELAELLSEASEPERDSDIEPKEARIETAESAPIGTTEPEPPFADLESTLYELMARIGQFFKSVIDPGETAESEPAELRAALQTLEAAEPE